MPWDWTLILQSAIGSFGGVGTVAILYEEWARRRREALEGTQGLRFGRDAGWRQEHTVGELNAWSSTSVSVSSAGPGVRHDLAAVVWIEGRNPNGKDLGKYRFTNESEEIDFVVRVPHPVDEKRPQVKFGLSWIVVHGSALRNEYVRVDLDSGEIEEWKWGRFYFTRKWWNEEKRFRLPWSGQKRPLGRWHTVATSSDFEWQGPLQAAASGPEEGRAIIEWDDDDEPYPALLPPPSFPFR